MGLTTPETERIVIPAPRPLEAPAPAPEPEPAREPASTEPVPVVT